MSTGTEVQHNKVWEQLRCIKESSQNAVPPHVRIIPAVNAIYTMFCIKYDNNLTPQSLSTLYSKSCKAERSDNLFTALEHFCQYRECFRPEVITHLFLLPPQIVCFTNNDAIMWPWRGYLYAEICWEIINSNTPRKSCFRPEDIKLNTG